MQTNNRKEKMMYLIIKEVKLSNTSIYNVVSFTDNLEKDVVYSIVKYEQPLKLTKEMEC